jgi:hypothetical protein
MQQRVETASSHLYIFVVFNNTLSFSASNVFIGKIDTLAFNCYFVAPIIGAKRFVRLEKKIIFISHYRQRCGVNQFY